jgi:5-hydroxyisourate hydrolase
MSQITTHVLDVSTGRPAVNVEVGLEVQNGDAWRELGRARTDNDGRLKGLLGATALGVGVYRLILHTGAYFAERRIATLYPQVNIVFEVRDATQHYHIPLLLSPFGYSTYRGS